MKIEYLDIYFHNKENFKNKLVTKKYRPTNLLLFDVSDYQTHIFLYICIQFFPHL